jgi:hypothetical protein
MSGQAQLSVRQSPLVRATFVSGCALPPCRLIIPLIIQTIRLDPTRPDQIDEALDVSRPDPSGADQIDAEHQATDLAVGGSNPSRRAKQPAQRCCSKRSSKHPVVA